MGRARTAGIIIGTGAAAGAAVAAVRGIRGAAGGHTAPGGILMGDAAGYDRHSRLLMGSFFGPVAADIAAAVPRSGRVLEVGCGPGHLSVRLAGHGLVVTGLDLDPAMIERARVNAERTTDGQPARPSFVVGDVAALPFPDASFDTVVSTLSMHHWADPTAGLGEIGRVLRPDGRALVWDIRPGVVPFHRHAPDPLTRIHGSGLRLVSATPWRWPWRFSFAQRIELVRGDERAS